MTKAATAVLEQLRNGAEFAYEARIGYIGNRRVKGATKILNELLRAMAVRRVETPGCTAEYYRAAGHVS